MEKTGKSTVTLEHGSGARITVRCGTDGIDLIEVRGFAPPSAAPSAKDSMSSLGANLEQMKAEELARLSSVSPGTIPWIADTEACAKSAAELIGRALDGDADAVMKAAFLPVDELSLGEGFTGKVLRLLRHVPAGRYITYGELAKAAGSPKAARAVGAAMAANPVVVAVPCHRVFGSGGRFTGFGGGLGMKAHLATLESKIK